MKHRILLSIGAALLGCSAVGQANPLPAAELSAFYQAMNGDQWLRKDGWLDADIPICEWHGVVCSINPQGEPTGINRIELPDNGLNGLFGAEILALINQVSFSVDLSGNQIAGNLTELPQIRELNLARNLLSGALPEATEPALPAASLNLSGNALEGEVPDSWEILSLSRLNLADNRLSGLPEAAFRAVSGSLGWQQLLLENNDFSGQLPDWLTEIELVGEDSLNLCWNTLTFSNDQVREWVQARHLGGPDLACLEHARRQPSPELSGSWFYPARSGEGFSLMLLDNNTALIYWFSHISRNRQKWLFQVADVNGKSLVFDRPYRTSGIFDQGFGDNEGLVQTRGKIRLDWLESGLLHGEYTLNYRWDDLSRQDEIIIIITPPLLPSHRRHDHWPLTQLAGTRCDNTQPLQWASGIWFNPERSGEGFVIEVNEDGRGLVYWFTHTPDPGNSSGGQAWMIGEGYFDGNRLIIPDLLQPRDSEDKMPSETVGIVLEAWGGLTIEFIDNDSAELSFASLSSLYGQGQYSLTRLARAKLADCSP